jgi:hypothetical protein
MIIYSAAADQPFITAPGEQLVYGEHENHPQGFGEVVVTPEGVTLVNGKTISRILREFPWVRKLPSRT